MRVLLARTDERTGLNHGPLDGRSDDALLESTWNAYERG